MIIRSPVSPHFDQSNGGEGHEGHNEASPSNDSSFTNTSPPSYVGRLPPTASRASAARRIARAVVLRVRAEDRDLARFQSIPSRELRIDTGVQASIGVNFLCIGSRIGVVE